MAQVTGTSTSTTGTATTQGTAPNETYVAAKQSEAAAIARLKLLEGQAAAAAAQEKAERVQDAAAREKKTQDRVAADKQKEAKDLSTTNQALGATGAVAGAVSTGCVIAAESVASVAAGIAA
ncbi:MAG: hypothetical protein ACD_62C00276G0004, partial [uncultured bacterium]